MVKAGRVSKDLLEPGLAKEIDDKLNKGDMIDWSKIANKPQLADGSWKPPVQSPADLPLLGNDPGDIRLTLDAEGYVFRWDATKSQWILIGANDTSVEWGHLKNVPSTFTPSVHTHKESDIADLDKYTKAQVDTKLTGKSDTTHKHAYSELTGVPTTFQPTSHTHSESDIIGLDKYTKAEVDTKLTGKANTSHTHTIANVTNLQTTLNTKVDKVTGKILTTHDFNDAYKAKLDALTDSAQLNYDALDTKITTHTADATIHVTPADKTTWNTVTNKADKSYTDTQLGTKANASVVTGHIDNTTIHTTQADKDAINAHIANATIHITSTERANWNAKSNFSGKYTDLTSIPTTFPATAHTHTWTEVTGKPTTFTPSTHTHSYTDLTNKPDLSIYLTQEDLTNLGAGDMLKSTYDVDGDGIVDRAKVADTVTWTGVTGKPTTFTPSAHSHVISDITDLTAQLASKASASTLTGHTDNATIHVTQTDKDNWNGKSTFSGKYTDLTSIPTTFAPSAHVHDYINSISTGSVNDPDTTTLSHVLSNHANSPGGGVYWHILTMFYTSRTGNRGQIAITYNGTVSRIMTRHCFSSVWTPWVEYTSKSTFDSHAHTWAQITGKPTTFTPATHTHSYNDLTDKPTIENYTVSVGTTQPTTDMWYKEV